ncbi:hypothetical protein BKA80DRAFT_261289 [Phyllosticta citrichinensis]
MERGDGEKWTERESPQGRSSGVGSSTLQSVSREQGSSSGVRRSPSSSHDVATRRRPTSRPPPHSISNLMYQFDRTRLCRPTTRRIVSLKNPPGAFLGPGDSTSLDSTSSLLTGLGACLSRSMPTAPSPAVSSAPSTLSVVSQYPPTVGAGEALRLAIGVLVGLPDLCTCGGSMRVVGGKLRRFKRMDAASGASS